MIYSLNGEVTYIGQNLIVVECGGVGYACHSTASAVSRAVMGEKLKLYTYLNLRQDAIDLFGFADEAELNCFKMLISVSGVGCKYAIAILSVLNPQEFALSVVNDDYKRIANAQGIGKKTAQKIIFELKDKISKENSFAFENTGIPQIDLGATASNAFSEALTALMVLGFTNAQAQGALEGLSLELSVQEMVKEGLKRLSGK